MMKSTCLIGQRLEAFFGARGLGDLVIESLEEFNDRRADCRIVIYDQNFHVALGNRILNSRSLTHFGLDGDACLGDCR